MKKTFTSLFLLAAACGFTTTAQAQDVVFTYDGVILESGATVILEAEAEELAPGVAFVEAKSNSDAHNLNLLNQASSAKTIKVTGKIVENTVPGSIKLGLCCGGNCVADTDGDGVVEKEGVIMESGSSIPAMYDVTFARPGESLENYGTVSTILKHNASLAYSINVNFVYNDPAGIHNVSTGSAITIGQRQLGYRFDTAGQRVIKVYSTGGQLVYSQSIGQSGSLDLSSLQTGTYVYSLEQNGKMKEVRRFLVK